MFISNKKYLIQPNYNKLLFTYLHNNLSLRKINLAISAITK